MANRELSKLEALAKAEAYCARAEHCAADVRRKINEWQVDPDFFDFIEQNLYDKGFLDDRRYCRAYVHDKVAYQKWGRIKIQAGLNALKLPATAIREALDQIDENTYFSNLRSLTASRRSVSPDQLLRFLAQRGFTYEEIKEHLNS